MKCGHKINNKKRDFDKTQKGNIDSSKTNQ